jgi:hypothetical protein
MSNNNIKIMLICSLNITGIIHFEVVPEGSTVNQTFYVEVLKRLIDAVRRKPGELKRHRSLIICHDNEQAHSSIRVAHFSAGKASPPWIIRRTHLNWLQVTSGCFQNSRVR